MSREADPISSDQESGEDRGVFVMGMHRSGSSAAARLINMLGVPLSEDSDLSSEYRPDNPKGYWESRALLAANDELLGLLGGSWSDPPHLTTGWPSNARLAQFREQAASTFRSVYHSSTWAWKDPRNCITLPFWLDVLPVRPLFVFMYRDPLEVWRSLAHRDGFTKGFSLLLWERYWRDALSNTRGMPVLVTSFDDLLADPMAWSVRVNAMLPSYGFDVHPPQAFDVHEFVDGRLRYAHAVPGESDRDPDLSSSQLKLAEIIRSLVGAHEHFVPEELPAPTEWTDALFAEHRRYLRERQQRTWQEAESRNLQEEHRKAEAESKRFAMEAAKVRRKAEAESKRFAKDLKEVTKARRKAEAESKRFAKDLKEVTKARRKAEIDLHRFLSSRSFRYTAWLRAISGALRRPLRKRAKGSSQT